MPLWANQLLPQLLMEQFDTLPIQCRHIEHMHEGVLFRKNNFWQNDSCENLDNFSLIRLLYMHRWCLHGPINSYYSFWWNNLILCRYNEGVLFRKNDFWQNDSCGNLDNFSLIRLLEMHRWCLHWPINSYHSFYRSNLILCLYNIDTLNICIRSLVEKKNWENDSWELWQLFPYMAFVYALIVPLQANQLLPKLLMKQFDKFSVQCRHIDHMHKGVYNFCWT